MKLKVFADQSGRILATYRPASGGKDAPTHLRFGVKGGYEHDIEVSDDLLKPSSIAVLHAEYRVDASGPAPKLVRPR